jgi:hypothetical protein
LDDLIKNRKSILREDEIKKSQKKIEPKRLGDEDVYGTWLNEIKPEELKIEDKSQKDL